MNLDGFQPHASGLLVPTELSREREVWTREERKTVERAIKALSVRGVAVFFGCPDPRCTSTPMQKLTNLDGSLTLRCAHKDRVMRRG